MNAATSITAHGLTGFLGRGAAPRELECLLAVAGGATGKEAARALGVTEDTIKKTSTFAYYEIGRNSPGGLGGQGVLAWVDSGNWRNRP